VHFSARRGERRVWIGGVDADGRRDPTNLERLNRSGSSHDGNMPLLKPLTICEEDFGVLQGCGMPGLNGDINRVQPVGGVGLEVESRNGRREQGAGRLVGRRYQGRS